VTTLDALPVPDAPFRGIESFRFIDQQIFAERDDEVWDLQSSVTRYRAVLLYGESGTGKSSLINAGLIPSAAKKNLVTDRIRLQPTLGQELIIERISITSDARRPYLPSTFVSDEASARVVLSLEEFVARLEASVKSPAPQTDFLAELANLDEVTATKAEDFNFTPQPRPLLIFDQFEELVTLFEPGNVAVADETVGTASADAPASADQKVIDDALRAHTEAFAKTREVQQRIIDALVRLVQDETLKIKLLFVFREDYLAKLNILFRRVPDLLDQYLRLLPPRPDVVTRIIRAPFERLPGVFVNRQPDGIGTEISESLAEQIKTKFIERGGGGALNLSELEIVCRRLWESKNPDSLFAQKKIAGVLEDYFSEKLGAFPSELQEPTVALLGLMITSGNTRNIISEDDLFSRVQKEEEIEQDKAEKARDLLLGTRLVWRELRNGVYFYTIASDYLAKWIAKKKAERVAERERRKLAQQAELIKLTQQDEAGVSGGGGGGAAAKSPGFDQRAFIARLQAADAEELSQIAARPSVEEEQALRAYFGDERYQSLHALAVHQRSGRASSAKGNVVVIPGLMGSELSVFASPSGAQAGDLLWLSPMRIALGRFSWLRLGDDGRSGEYDVRPTGILKRQYGELLLSLSENWNVRSFWFDWRKDINLAAVELESHVSRWFGDEPVHIVAHDMGGLVARAFIGRYPKRWRAMWDAQSGVPGRRGGRLIMLGTPNHGTYAIPQLISGLDPTVKKIGLLDLRHGHDEVLQIFNSFVGQYQMLPSPLVVPAAEQLYESSLYGKLNVPQNRLDAAHKFHYSIREVADPDRMIYVAGRNRRTLSGIKDYRKVGSLEAYDVTMEGDGRVPHSLGLLSTPDGREIAAYSVEDDHANLPANSSVLSALNSLLETGATAELQHLERQRRNKKLSVIDKKVARERLAAAEVDVEKQLSTLSRRVRSLAAEAGQATTFSPEELKIEELMTRGYLSDGADKSPQRTRAAAIDIETQTIEVGLAYGSIASIEYGRVRSKKGDPVDSIAVGHYIGVLPQGAELWLDRAISLPQEKSQSFQAGQEEGFLLRQYTEWGIIHGELGRPFFLNDPRTTRSSSAQRPGRVIAIAGMGTPGRFGAPELVVLARNLCWSLGRIGRHHLATILIGTGDGNLTIRDAVSAWIKGIQRALISVPKYQNRLLRITFVESNPRKILSIQEAILNERKQLSEANAGLTIEYKELTKTTLERIATDGQKMERNELLKLQRSATGKSGAPVSDSSSLFPIRVSISLEGKSCRISAISEGASLPEREISIDPALIDAAKDELIGDNTPAKQLERARFLRQQLMSTELASLLTNNVPLILMLDANAARIPWEMLAQPESVSSSVSLKQENEGNDFIDFDKYLGTSRGLTRQLPLMYSMLPDPPPPPRRILRVLVVADPAEDARLPGAEAEGVEVANLFESFNAVYGPESKNRVEVVKLLGPLEASRTNVLRELMIRNYDVLHFAGHCIYDELEPSASGWWFGKGERLSPRELNRTDSIPRFIFSNAGGSNLAQSSSRTQNAGTVVNFAEAFLARGVANFIYPAWPVGDACARQFVQKLYAGLLGLKPKAQRIGYERAEPQPLDVAVREARLAVAATPEGERVWGAYQHYGSRQFPFFASRHQLRR
jgi:hypothetical protein